MTTHNEQPTYILVDKDGPWNTEEFSDVLVKVRDSQDPEHPERCLLQTIWTGWKARAWAEAFAEACREHGHYAQVAPECFILAEPGQRTVADELRVREN